MEENQDNKNGNGTGCLIIILIIVAIIFIPIIFNTLKESNESLQKTKLEGKLIEEGKVKTYDKTINEILEILKNKDENKLKEYLSNDFLYYDNNNRESKYITAFFRDLKILSSEYDIERRGDTSRDDVVTYRIYWNVVNGNKSLGRTSQYYCLQKVTIMLKRIVKQDIITYEVDKIILKDN